MSKFRKRPVVINAVQVTAADYNGKNWDGSPFSDMPKWLLKALKTGVVTVEPSTTDYALWRVGTLEDGPDGQAKHIASPGDWIIQGVEGELYPCKPGIFEKTYEPVEDEEESQV